MQKNTMILHELKLKNFKGIKNFSIAIDGKNASIFGDNATGKTTLYDAVCWLLFDKDSLGKKDFSIKTLDSTGNELHNLEHDVEGKFTVGGTSVALRKIYKEVWTKKRGELSKKMTGHTTDYFIDEVPKQKKEYDEFCSGVINEDLFRLLTSPSFFAETLDWKKRREILLTICGDITDGDVVALNPELEGIVELLDGKGADDRKKILTAQRANINKRLDEIPTRIDELSTMLGDTEESTEVIDEQVAVLQGSLADLQSKKATSKTSDVLAEKRTELIKLSNAAVTLTQKHLANNSSNAAVIKESNSINLEINTLEGKRAANNKHRIELQGEIVTCERDKERLTNEWHKIAGETFDNNSTICPTCKQELPEDAIEKAIESFNLNQSNAKESINKKGQAHNAKIEGCRKLIQAASENIELINADIEKLQKKQATLVATKPPSIEELPEYRDLVQQQLEAQQQIDNLVLNATDVFNSFDVEIQEVSGKIASLNKQLAVIDANKKTKERIAELGKEEKGLSAQFEETEKGLFLLGEFMRCKVSMLEEHISDRFEFTKFKLFQEQVNGGLAECCEVMENGVPYRSLNNAARVQCGMDIIRTLSTYHQFWPMLFIDNRESVTTLPVMECQLISLIVSAKHSNLHIEVEA